MRVSPKHKHEQTNERYRESFRRIIVQKTATESRNIPSVILSVIQITRHVFFLFSPGVNVMVFMLLLRLHCHHSINEESSQELRGREEIFGYGKRHMETL